MGQILIRNLDDAVPEALRRLAAERGGPLEDEVRRALTASVGLTRAEALARLDAARLRIGRREGAPSLEDLRFDRDRDLTD
jgi:plasmid stability protein